MANVAISAMQAADALAGDELVEVSQLSTTVKITATTISAQASDNSFNDSALGFGAAGFAVGDRVRVYGFTGNVANNILSGVITALTTGKMTIGGTDGDVIVDDAAGESVTIAKWFSRRTTADDIADLTPTGGGGGGSSVGRPVYLFGTFQNADMRFKIGVSHDGLGFKWLVNPAYDPPTDELRDPSFCFFNGKWWVAYTNPPTGNVYAGTVTHFSVASSDDLVTWSHVFDVSVTAISSVDYCWAPEWFIDDDDSVHVFFCATANADHINDFNIYEIHPTNDAATTWSAPVVVTGTSLPGSLLDPFMVKIGSDYHLWFKNNSTERLGYMTSSSLTSGYTVVQSGSTNWSGFGSPIEGASVVKVGDVWRMYFDKYTDQGFYYSESDDDFATWTTPALVGLPTGTSVLNHGTVLSVTDLAQQSNILGALTRFIEASSGGGGGGSTPVSPDDYPSSPDLADDEFEGSSLDTAGTRVTGAKAWAWRNQGGASFTQGEGYGVLNGTAQTTANLRIVEQVVGAGPWRYQCKLRAVEVAAGAGFSLVGICVVNNTSGKVLGIYKGYNASIAIAGDKWTNVTTYGASLISAINLAATHIAHSMSDPIYLEIELSGTNLLFKYSLNGFTWTVAATEALATFITSVDRIGLIAHNDTVANKPVGIYDWFRRVA